MRHQHHTLMDFLENLTKLVFGIVVLVALFYLCWKLVAILFLGYEFSNFTLSIVAALYMLDALLKFFKANK